MARVNFYSGAGLDRADHLRLDEAWLAAQLRRSTTRYVVIWRARNFVVSASDPRPAWLDWSRAEALWAQAEHVTFLGLNGQHAYVALDLSAVDRPAEAAGLSELGEFQDLRLVGPLMARGEGAVLAYARGLVHWHKRHRFCGRCGHPTESRRAGHLRHCTNPDCGLDHFPRTDPAVIMLIHDGGDRCVLGRQKGWPSGMHSTLAGFVEPGESLEEAVAREVEEEVGLKLALAKITYHSSQPWPFPSSIMLGFHAQAAYGPLKVCEEELDTAAWFTRDQLKASPEDERFKLPRRDSIAWRLIEDWLAEG
ncbi:MAG: NAD(+) diphosphatase [Pseudomonadota bacterium]